MAKRDIDENKHRTKCVFSPKSSRDLDIGFDWFSFRFYTSFVAKQQIFSNELNMIQCIAIITLLFRIHRHLSTKKLAGSCATVALIVEKGYGRVPGQLIQSNNTDASLKMLGFLPAFAAIFWMN